MFKVGDHIVYPMYGAGIITDIVEKDFLGEIRMYYSVSLPYSRMDASVPVDNCEKLGVRAVIDQGRIEEVLDVLKGDTEPMNPNWNKSKGGQSQASFDRGEETPRYSQADP